MFLAHSVLIFLLLFIAYEFTQVLSFVFVVERITSLSTMILSLNVMPLILVAIFIHRSMGTNFGVISFQSLADTPLVIFSADVGSRHQKSLRMRHPSSPTTGRTEPTVVINSVNRLYLRRNLVAVDDKEQNPQEQNPIKQGIHRTRVWLEVAYQKLPPEVGMVLLILFMVLGAACAACCCFTPCFYMYDHYLDHKATVWEPADEERAEQKGSKVEAQENPTTMSMRSKEIR